MKLLIVSLMLLIVGCFSCSHLNNKSTKELHYARLKFVDKENGNTDVIKVLFLYGEKFDLDIPARNISSIDRFYINGVQLSRNILNLSVKATKDGNKVFNSLTKKYRITGGNSVILLSDDYFLHIDLGDATEHYH